ncbi:ATP-dependent DNA helicase [Trichonephila inaurata madagascariensis]|uniref:ATP-dependent DNA helicase n=1 Tax=Trichonephila inaurata madagascariensis TaxID=2747483 RepID=A0A8X6XH31_9ARAC|nr:ATP-dependent DNA helicase [Trichonephila inaurata madagascariensis]
MKILRLRVRDSHTIGFKHVGKDTKITRKQIEDEDYINNCIETNLAFLKSIPNSMWYWADKKKNLFAMIRQLGKPTVFLTISSNEIGWTELIQLLYKVLKKEAELSKEDAEQLHYLEKITYKRRSQFQHRGSPHAHILLWIANAPKDALGATKIAATSLINDLILISSEEASGHIKLQTHKHTFKCYQKISANKPQQCRFEAPFMPNR